MKSYQMIGLVVLLTLAAVGCKKKPDEAGIPKASQSTQVVADLTDEQKRIQTITVSETLILALSGKKSLLAKSFTSEPVDTTLFADSKIDYTGIADADLLALIADAKSNESADSLATMVQWPIADSAMSSAFSEIWAPLLKEHRFEDAEFGVLKGTLLDSGEFEMETKFEGCIPMADGGLCGVSGYQRLSWREVGPDDWKIVSWRQEKLKVISTEKPLFKNVTAAVFPDKETLKKVLTATHQDLIVTRCDELEQAVKQLNLDRQQSPEQRQLISSGFEARAEFKGCNDWTSVGQYPSASSVDFDQDGFDDLFITDRWQSPQLLRNNGDGTFVDVTEESGIDVAEMVTCAYFFDYDNDGDDDLFLGLSMVPSLFFVNEGGTFSRHRAINQVLEETRFVNSVSVADINRDGLLDLYLSTYATGTGPIEDWIGFITREKEQLKTRLKIERADKFVDRGGPPNILLMNRGDSFEWVKITDVLKQYRGSYQSCWTDYDEDGDQDLYICNDFSPDVFLRNDTEQGSFEPRFTDVTQEVVPTMDMGFGMGCTWGDFDNDRDLDLYVSNMYSKAGNRIVDQIEGADPRLKVAAHGNFLFENIGGKFRQIAGDRDDQQHVSRVGWSYGGQFADFDNDGHLDIYVPSGCYSAPPEVETKIDL